MTAKLGNILTNKERHEIASEMYRMENTKHTKTTREREIIRLVKITNDLYNKQKQHTSRHHDQTYYGIKDRENLLEDEIDDYYQPILVRSYFDNNFEEYELQGNKKKNLSIKEYIFIILTKLHELIDKKKKSTNDEQTVQLIIAVICRHITDPSKKYATYVRSKNTDIRSGDDTNDIVSKIIESFLENYEHKQNALRNGSSFIYDSVDYGLLQFDKIKFKRGGSYIATPKWIANKKATINPKNRQDSCCFAYSIVAAIHHKDIDHHPEKITKLAPYVNNYNWNDINFPTEQKVWKTFERNNKDIALKILSVDQEKPKFNIARRSDFNPKRLHQVILLMFTGNKNNWHYFAVKDFERLCRRVTSNNHDDHCCLNCLHSYRTENSLIQHERLCNDHDFCEAIMPTEGKNILKLRHDKKSIPMPHLIYADLECILKRSNHANRIRINHIH